MSNMMDVVTTAINVVGGAGADWRVQAGAAALVMLVGTGVVAVKKLKFKRKKK